MNIFSFVFKSKSNKDYFINETETFLKNLEKSNDYLKEFEKFKKIVNEYFFRNYKLKYKFTFEDLKIDLKESDLNLNSEETNLIENLCDFLNEIEFDLSKINYENLKKATELFLELISYKAKHNNKLVDFKINDNKINTNLQFNKNVRDNLPFNTNVITNRVENTKINQDFSKDLKKFDETKTNLLSETNLESKENNNQDLNFFNENNNNDLPTFSLGNFEKEQKSNIKDIKNNNVLDEDKKNLEKNVEKEASNEIQKNDAIIKIKNQNYQQQNLENNISKENILENNEKELAKKKNIEKNFNKNFKKLNLKKSKELKKDLIDIKKSLKDNKITLEEQIFLIEKQQDLIKKEQKNLDKLYDNQENKKKDLKIEEKNIDEKIKSISIIEEQLKKEELRIKKDKENLEEEKKSLERKSILIESIKKELNEKYEIALREIDNLKKELKEKEKNFLELQEFFNQRENKLSVEEHNFLEEKRRHKKFYSNLLKKQIEISLRDLKSVNERLDFVKKNNNELQKKINDLEVKSSENLENIKKLRDEIKQKEDYFKTLEKDFQEKEIYYQNLSKSLIEKENNLIEKEKNLKNYEYLVNKTENDLRIKNRDIEIKETDLKRIEKEIEKLNFDLKNKNFRIQLMKKHIENRIQSYEKLKKNINLDINREKREIFRIERKLKRKGISIDLNLGKIEKKEKQLNELKYGLKNLTKSEEKNNEIEIKELDNFSDEYIGNPNILDILRLLNISRDFLKNNQKERAKDAYLEIQRLFEELEEQEREDIYPEILEVFKTKDYGNILSNKYVEIQSSIDKSDFVEDNNTSYNIYNKNYNKAQISQEDIQSLIHQFEVYVETKDLINAQNIYEILQEKYLVMNNEEKEKYYPQIMDVYNRLLDKEVNLIK